MVDIVLSQIITGLGIGGLGVYLMYQIVRDNLKFTRDILIKEYTEQREEHRIQLEKLNQLCFIKSKKKKPLKN